MIYVWAVIVLLFIWILTGFYFLGLLLWWLDPKAAWLKSKAFYMKLRHGDESDQASKADLEYLGLWVSRGKKLRAKRRPK